MAVAMLIGPRPNNLTSVDELETPVQGVQDAHQGALST